MYSYLLADVIVFVAMLFWRLASFPSLLLAPLLVALSLRVGNTCLRPFVALASEAASVKSTRTLLPLPLVST